eukprot:GHVT01010060.1.p1 GENE.GHVT01010060.1~~GHVT01010060.1.p1  ORF type:complete len:429 (-),score=67.58 GHVT01010060.1:870-2156(-)
MAIFGHYIPPKGLQRLAKYKYHSGGCTPLDKVMNHWWEFAVKLVPPVVSPNMLTLAGFFCALALCATTLWHSPWLDDPLPPWVSAFIALGIFVHQTFDAIDGKHARRTGMQSPLGQLFDHGCDIMVTVPLILVSLALIQSGVGGTAFAIITLATQMLQYIYMWWELHFGVFFASTGGCGVTEGQLVMAFVALSTACGYTGWLSTDVLAMLPVSLRDLVVPWLFPLIGGELSCLTLLVFLMILTNFGSVCLSGCMGLLAAKDKLLAGRQLLAVAIFVAAEWFIWEACVLTYPSSLKQFDSSTSSFGACSYLYWLSQQMSLWVFLLFSTAHSILVVRFCLSSTCKLHFSFWQWPLIPFLFLAAGLRANLIPDPHTHPRVKLLVAVVCAWQVFYLLDLLLTSVCDICKALGVPCLAASPKQSPPKRADKVK